MARIKNRRCNSSMACPKAGNRKGRVRRGRRGVFGLMTEGRTKSAKEVIDPIDDPRNWASTATKRLRRRSNG